jgi:nitrogen regulatory protein P-II 1
MKKIEAIIRVEKFKEVKDALEELGYPGMTKTLVEGHGKQKGIRQQFRGTTFKVELIPKIKLELVVFDEDVSRTLEAIIRGARTGMVGDGKIFVLPVESAIRIRTGDKDENAI